jgi:hypothetical protein
MIGLPFIEAFFKNILSKSKGIDGRLFYCPNMGREINTDEFEQIIEDQFDKSTQKKFPCVIMMPPISQGKFIDPKGEWEEYSFIMFFLTTTYYDGNNQIKDVNVNTQTSTHTILSDQHDMGRCARNFVHVADKVTRVKHVVNCKFRVVNENKIVRPVANIGSKRLSGVRIDFRGQVLNGCVVEDYNQEDIDEIIIPEGDPHPEHSL